MLSRILSSVLSQMGRVCSYSFEHTYKLTHISLLKQFTNLNQCNPVHLCLLLANLPAPCLLLSYLPEISVFLDILTSVDY